MILIQASGLIQNHIISKHLLTAN